VVTVLEPPTIRRLAFINRKFEKEGTRFDENSLHAFAIFFGHLISEDSTLFRKPSNAGLMEQEQQLALPSLQPQFHIAVERFVHSAQAQGLMADLIAVAKEVASYFSTDSAIAMWRLSNLENEPEMDLQTRLKNLVLLWGKWTSGVALIDTISSGALANNRTSYISRRDDGYSNVEGKARLAFAMTCYYCISKPEEVPEAGDPLDLLELLGKVGVQTETPMDRAMLSKAFAAIETLKGLPWPSLEVGNDDEANETGEPTGPTEGTDDAAVQETEEDAVEDVDAGVNEDPGKKTPHSPEKTEKIKAVIAEVRQAFSTLEESVAAALEKAKHEDETLIGSIKKDKDGNAMLVTITVDEDEVFLMPFDHHFIKSSTFLSSLQLMPGDKIKLNVDLNAMKTAMAFYDLDVVDPYDENSRGFWRDGDFAEAVGTQYARLVEDLSFQEVNDLKGLAQFFTLNKLQHLCENALKLPAHQEQVRRNWQARFPDVEAFMRARLPPGATLVDTFYSV